MGNIGTEKRLRLDRVNLLKKNEALQIRTDRQKNKRIKCSFSGSLVMVREDILILSLY